MIHQDKEVKNTKSKAKPTCCCSHDEPAHSDNDGHDHGGHDHEHNAEGGLFKLFLPSIISFVLLIIGIGFDNYIPQDWFTVYVRIVWYAIAYLPVGLPVLREAYESIVKGDIFSEFFLMCIATIGAFAIGEYPEGVAVMLFYTIGETFQGMAVNRAKSSIKSLLDQRPDEVHVLENNVAVKIKARDVQIGAIIQLKAGEKLGLDG